LALGEDAGGELRKKAAAFLKKGRRALRAAQNFCWGTGYGGANAHAPANKSLFWAGGQPSFSSEKELLPFTLTQIRLAQIGQVHRPL
jgi:hypothetical protein